jgi:voltage-gated potassium channel
MNFRSKLFHIIFGTDTKAGKTFDVVLLWLILGSVLVVMLESIPQLHYKYLEVFTVLEYMFTFLFTIEYFLRIWTARKPMSYILSFWGVIDLLSIVPTYLSLFVVGSQYLVVVRIFRLLRVFRILKLGRFHRESRMLLEALRASNYRISVFLTAVLAIVTLLGTLMYVLEGGKEGFTSIPQSIYWAIVTVTTVGYGDMVPQTVIGKVISSFAMILGYSIIAVPTGIVSVEIAKAAKTARECTHCKTINELSAKYCNQCGFKFSEAEMDH